MSLLTMVIIFFVLSTILGLPIVFVIIGSTVLPGFMDHSFMANTSYVVRSIVAAGDATALLAPPLFTLSGIIMARGGIAKRIFNLFTYFVGDLPGGVPSAVVLTCLFYGCISGSGTATAAAVGSMTIPILLELGYKPRFIGALVACSAGLGVIIPPSTPYIMFGIATNTSIGDLFTAGILPGCLLALCIIVYTVWHCARAGEDKEKIHRVVGELRKQGLASLFKESFWALLTPVILLGGLYSGIITTVEVAVVSVIYALIISCFVYRSADAKGVGQMFMQAQKASAPLNIMIISATVFGRILTMFQVPTTIAHFMITTFGGNKVMILIIINIFLLLIGMVMDTQPAILIFGPMLITLTNQLGVNPVHLGIFMTINMAIGFVTPPFGQTLFITGPLVGEKPLSLGVRAYPIIGWMLVALLIITFVPGISLFLVGR